MKGKLNEYLDLLIIFWEVLATLAKYCGSLRGGRSADNYGKVHVRVLWFLLLLYK